MRYTIIHLHPNLELHTKEVVDCDLMVSCIGHLVFLSTVRNYVLSQYGNVSPKLDQVLWAATQRLLFSARLITRITRPKATRLIQSNYRTGAMKYRAKTVIGQIM